ncbi:penicillin-binding protein [Chryseobacterium artocarpi]|uniref:Penicillin-binding protein n=2 Tax=Chryseobacterium artocarpi TaxID=1414727 RepID=A0A1B8ZZZ1_9FLAO|nr:penicillin-binding protein [Chryseobacterium artocarpi]
MTRSNLHITLSNGKKFICVLDGSSAPEQGYIVEDILLPLLSFHNGDRELSLIKKHCTMGERRANACYRYTVDLIGKEIRMFEEHYSYNRDVFRKGKEITERYTDYVQKLNLQDDEEKD